MDTALIKDHLGLLETTSETTPGNEALAADYRAMLFEINNLTSRLSTVEAANTDLRKTLADYESASSLNDTRLLLAKTEAQRDSLKQELAEQEAAALQWAKTLECYSRAASNLLLWWTETGLPGSPVVDYIPQSDQYDALAEFRKALAKLAPPAPQEAEAAAPQVGRPYLRHEVEHGFNPDPAAEPWRAAFDNLADYNASAQDGAAKIASGEVQPREPDEEAPEFCQCSFAMILRGEDDMPYCSQCRRLIQEEMPAAPTLGSKPEGGQAL